jgi:hypothetical protein
MAATKTASTKVTAATAAATTEVPTTTAAAVGPCRLTKRNKSGDY